MAQDNASLGDFATLAYQIGSFPVVIGAVMNTGITNGITTTMVPCEFLNSNFMRKFASTHEQDDMEFEIASDNTDAEVDQQLNQFQNDRTLVRWIYTLPNESGGESPLVEPFTFDAYISKQSQTVKKREVMVKKITLTPDDAPVEWAGVEEEMGIMSQSASFLDEESVPTVAEVLAKVELPKQQAEVGTE